ncbi:MAG: GNAT family N-acetyltransferase [Bacteriovoracaceae bacterium]|nr:GNAT family N-acetyltransferase [Bacteriovoracaceae bacterium]
MKIIDNWKSIDFKKVLDLYDSVGWSAYTNDPDTLLKAFENTTYVLLALEGDKVVGALRSVSDEVSIHYLQDILINPEFQKKGLGRKLLEKSLDRFKEVRTHMILTDDEEKQLLFYQSLGYKNTKSLKDIPLNTFVKMNGVELS